MQQGGSNYLFTPDHLGTVREMTDTAGAARARYELDPYGRRTKTAGDLDTDLGFTSTTAHNASGLSLAVFRAYDPDRARWLNEDPVGLEGGLNLYAYVDGDPINQVDPLGLWSQWHQMAATVLPGLWLWHPTVLNSSPMMWAINPTSVNASAGFGDAILGPVAAPLRASLGLCGVVNTSSNAYNRGWWVGFATSLIVGAKGGAALGAKLEPSRFMFSHFIPSRVLNWIAVRMPTPIATFIFGKFGWSSFNGAYVTPWWHAMTDPKFFVPGVAPLFGKWLSWILRVPPLYLGAAAGGVWSNQSKPCP